MPLPAGAAAPPAGSGQQVRLTIQLNSSAKCKFEDDLEKVKERARVADLMGSLRAEMATKMQKMEAQMFNKIETGER